MLVVKQPQRRTAEIYYAGLGDHLAMAGAMVDLEDRGYIVYLSAPSHYIVSVSSFFVGHPWIEVMEPTAKQKEWMAKNVTVGPKIPFMSVENSDVKQKPSAFSVENTEVPGGDMYKNMYTKLGIDYECRWSKSPIREAASRMEQVVVGADDYIFLHHDVTRGYGINRDKLPKGTGYFPGFEPQRSILAFKDAIENAREVHVIDSCCFHLTEQLEPKGILFLHRYACPYYPSINQYEFHHDWNVVW